MSKPSKLHSLVRWAVPARIVVFVLSATSIWSLMVEFYGLGSMRTFTLIVLIPSMIGLIALAAISACSDDRRLFRAVWIGAIGGLLAAFAYDLFRVPFVLGYFQHVGPVTLRLPLFKVFPRFGATILNQPFTNATTDAQFTLAAHLTGWAYHFSNGITFGIMYIALIGNPARRSWMWAIVLAVFLELAMLFTPYPQFFGIKVTAAFVVVTLTAHLLFGVVLGLFVRSRFRERVLVQ